MTNSIYIHIPFCKDICSYCDFCKMYKNKIFVKSYLDELEKEIKKYYQTDIIKTLYIGGGTPSSLNNIELKKLFKIIDIFKLSKDYEFTFECNINDINEKLLLFLKNNKVNRLSIGVQSFNKNLLKMMNRKCCNVKEKIEIAKKYFSNINVDLIYGINGETIDDVKTDLDNFLSLDITHISIYSLILEENTLLKVNNYVEISDEENRKMYDYIRKYLKKHGFSQYEISNFCKKGYFSKHNLIYWNNLEYYGFGLGASGFLNNIRYTNTRSLNNYLKGNYRVEEYNVSLKENMENFMILGLRKIKGVSKKDFYNRYNKKIDEVFNVEKLKENKKNFYISKKDLFVENSILVDFIDI